MLTLKHDINSPKLYKVLIKPELKGETDLDLKNFYNHTKMFINTVTRLREVLIPGLKFIKKLQVSGILCPRLRLTSLLLECSYIHFPWTLTVSDNE